MNAKTKRLLGTLGELVGAVAFFALVGVVAVLCCAASGYHWE